MLETKVLSITENQEKRLNKNEFNAKFRFREARKEGLVACVSCANMFGGVKPEETALCQHQERLRRIKIAQYHEGFWGEKGESENISPRMVCDAYASKPLPEGVVVPSIPDYHAVLLGTQWKDPYHLDSKCPYLVEEARIIATGEKVRGRQGEFTFVDISEWVPGEVVRDMCDLPCCESKLEVQIRDPNGYRTHVGIHPNADDLIRWVRNGIVKHGKNANMTIEEAEAFFDLTKVSSGRRDIYDQIVAVSDYMHKGCNWLGSRPLSEATNPVGFSNMHHFLDEQRTPQHPDIFWAYDERLVDRNITLNVPLFDLDKIPEGYLLCLDNKGILRDGISACSQYYGYSLPNYKESPSNFWARGILKPMENPAFLSKGVNYFLDIREVYFGGHSCDHMWGEFGIRFSGLESFHEE
ncbi:MAG: hypothetical protein AABX07_00125 [Nanoarchaeota archaeon]